MPDLVPSTAVCRHWCRSMPLHASARSALSVSTRYSKGSSLSSKQRVGGFKSLPGCQQTLRSRSSFRNHSRRSGDGSLLWCRLPPFAAANRIREAGTFGGKEVPVEIEQQLRARPSAHVLEPLDVRTQGEVKAGEGVPQPMRAEVPVRPQRARGRQGKGPRLHRVDPSAWSAVFSTNERRRFRPGMKTLGVPQPDGQRCLQPMCLKWTTSARRGSCALRRAFRGKMRKFG